MLRNKKGNIFLMTLLLNQFTTREINLFLIIIGKYHTSQCHTIFYPIHQILAYAHDVNLLGDNTDVIKKNAETLIDVGSAIGLEINVEKTKY
jgi:hypothetical protein